MIISSSFFFLPFPPFAWRDFPRPANLWDELLPRQGGSLQPSTVASNVVLFPLSKNPSRPFPTQRTRLCRLPLAGVFQSRDQPAACDKVPRMTLLLSFRAQGWCLSTELILYSHLTLSFQRWLRGEQNEAPKRRGGGHGTGKQRGSTLPSSPGCP